MFFDAEEPSTSRGAIPADPVRIVVADDDDDMRALIAVALRSDGYDVREAKDGVALLEILSDRRAPHIVISDVRMPGVDGLTMLAALRRVGQRFPVILMSAYCNHEIRDEARSNGADVFLEKPFDMDQLRRAVHDLRPRTRV